MPRRRALVDSSLGLTATDEQVWLLLLQYEWQEPELQVVSKLLCVSSAMAQLVRRTCEGRVRVRLASSTTAPRPPPGSRHALKGWVGQVVAESQLWGRWLAKNGRLLCSLELLVEPEAERAISVGLMQAAVGSGFSATTTRSKARLLTAAGDVDLGFTRPGTAKRQGLLLRRLLFGDSPPSTQLLLSAACRTLRLLVSAIPCQPAAAEHHAAALAQLSSLQQLFLISQPGTGGSTSTSGGSNSSFSAHCAAVGQLSCLQQLVLFSMDQAPLQQQDVSTLPRGLLQLHAAVGCTAHTSPGLDLSHLQQLEHLSLPWLGKGLRLPPSVTRLEALGCSDLGAVLAQQQVRCLRLWVSRLGPMQLQQLEALPKHQELQLGCVFDPSGQITLEAHARVPQLRSLELVDGVLGPAAADALGRLTQLNSLAILCRRVDVPVKQLLSRLQQLKGLQWLTVLLPPPQLQCRQHQQLLSALCSSRGFMSYAGCQHLLPFSGLLQQQSGSSGHPGGDACMFTMHCFAAAAPTSTDGHTSSSSNSLLGLLAHSTWHTLLSKQPQQVPVGSAAPAEDEAVEQQEAAPAAAAAAAAAAVAAAPAQQQPQQQHHAGPVVAPAAPAAPANQQQGAAAMGLAQC